MRGSTNSVTCAARWHRVDVLVVSVKHKVHQVAVVPAGRVHVNQ